MLMLVLEQATPDASCISAYGIGSLGAQRANAHRTVMFFSLKTWRGRVSLAATVST